MAIADPGRHFPDAPGTVVPPAPEPSPAVAYLCSRYPAISHTFVMREILALRRQGLRVETFTVRRTPPDELLSDLDREEDRATTALLPASPARVLAVVAAQLRRRGGFTALREALREAWRLRRPGLKGTVWQLFYLVEALILVEGCRRRGIHHVHAHFANVSSDVALLAGVLGARDGRGLSWSFTLHGPSDFWNVDQVRLADKAARASFVACISHYARSQLMGLSAPEVWPRLKVIRCGVERPPRERPEPPAQGPVRLLNVGRLAPVKGQRLLIDLGRALRDRGIAFELTIVGTGPEQEKLEQAVVAGGLQDRVRLTGALPLAEVGALMQASDLFVLPSFAEGVPVVLMEAMSAGVPVVATRIAGVPELVEDGVSGVVVTPGRSDELIEAVSGLIEDPERRAALASAGREVVRERFDIDREAGALAQLFASAMAGADTPPNS